jgi:hypothetical protein
MASVWAQQSFIAGARSRRVLGTFAVTGGLRGDVNIDGHNRIAIRRARASDAPQLLRLIRAYYRFDGIRFRPAAVAQALARLLKNRQLGSVWIMRDGIKAIGYVLLTFNFDLEFGGLEGVVTDLYIDERYRGGGLGKRTRNRG